MSTPKYPISTVSSETTGRMSSPPNRNRKRSSTMESMDGGDHEAGGLPGDSDAAGPSRTPDTGPIRTKLACATCRANKVRCNRPADPNLPCARCERYGTACVDPVIKPKGRPRIGAPRMSSPSRPRRDGVPTFAQVPNQVPNQGMPMSASRGLSMSLPDMSFDGFATTMPPAQTFNIRDPMSLSPTHPVHGISPSSLSQGGNQGGANMNMTDMLDPGDRDELDNAPRAPFYPNNPAMRRSIMEPVADGSERDDPVTLQAVSTVEAESLVNLFHQKLNPMVAVLDPSLHTMAYLRRTSSVLFATVLACSSRFFRRDLHSLLGPHAQTALDRAVIQGRADVGIIQSLMLSTYWKAPSDTSAWLKVGMAIRIAYSLFWHIPRSEPLPVDEELARVVLNPERTWFCLFSFDRGLGYVYGLPPAIRLRDQSDPELWARSHLHLGPSVDMHIAASIQLCKLKDHWGTVCELKSPDPAYIETAIETITTECNSWIDKWFSRDFPSPGFRQDNEHVMLWSILDFMLIMQRYRVEIAVFDHLRLDSCLAVASRIAGEIDLLADNGELEIMQDTASCMTSSMVVFLRKIFSHATHAQKANIVSLLHRILLSHNRAASEEGETAIAYVSRFLRRILAAMGTESKAGSPRPGALGVPSGMGPSENYDFLADLGLSEFLQVPDHVQQTEADDGQYWAMLTSVWNNPQI